LLEEGERRGSVNRGQPIQNRFGGGGVSPINIVQVKSAVENQLNFCNSKRKKGAMKGLKDEMKGKVLLARMWGEKRKSQK